MGNRDYKQSGIGEYFHIYNRGNSKNNIFLNDDDFKFFILKINQNLFPSIYNQNRIHSTPIPENSFSIISYCLMPNHFHFLVKQNSTVTISKLILKVCTSYSKYFNKKYEKVGHVFQDQFKQVFIEDNSYLLWLSAYIHLNPKVARLTNNAGDYKWSSYADYIGLNKSSINCEKELIINQFSGCSDYNNFVEDSYNIIKTKKELESLLID